MKKSFLLLIGIAIQFALFNSISLAQEDTKTGCLRGVIMGADSNKALAGAALILCQSKSDGECSIQAELIATSDEKGRFVFNLVPPGKYVVLYDPLGKAVSTWKTINGLTINYKLGQPKNFDSFMTKEFYETFGGGGAIVVRKGTKGAFKDGKVASVDGSFTSIKFGLTIDFRDGKPPTVEIVQGKTVEIEIKARGL
jgi:hypothetical protein